MQPGHGRDTRRDDCSQPHCPHRMTPGHGTDLTQLSTPDPRLPFPAARSSGSLAGHLKDASGAATAAGLRPVLDLPGRSPRHGSYQETGDASHARPDK
jgi:hypothetical protein